MSSTTTDHQAEQAVLGAVLLDASVIPGLGLTANDFARPEHRRIFEAAMAIVVDGGTVDAVLVAERMKGAGRLEYLVDLAEACATPANAGAYAEIVRRGSLRRHALAKLAEAQDEVQRGARPVADVMADVAASAEGMASDNAHAPLTMSDVITRAMAAAHDAYERRKQGGVVGAPSGLAALDARVGGLIGPRLMIIAGRPGVGKTALATQWALHSANRGFRVGICSMEMSDSETGMRSLAVCAGLNAAALARGTSDEYQRLQGLVTSNKLAAIRALPIRFDFDSFSLSAITARISEWRRSERIDFAIVDHIGLIEAEGFSSRVEQLGAISRTLKKLAKRLQIPIVALSQLNRRVEQEKRVPVLADLRDSGNLEQDADAVLMLHGVGEPDAHGVIDVEIGPLKLRDGVKGWLPCKFKFDGRTQRFREIAVEGTRVSAEPSARRRGGQ